MPLDDREADLEQQGDKVAEGSLRPRTASGSFLSAPPVLDLERLAELVEQAGSVEIVIELTELFLEDLPQRLAQLSAAVDRQDTEAIRRAAHGVKGAALNFGACRVAEHAERMEREPESVDVPIVRAQLEHEYSRVHQLLKDYVLCPDRRESLFAVESG